MEEVSDAAYPGLCDEERTNTIAYEDNTSEKIDSECHKRLPQHTLPLKTRHIRRTSGPASVVDATIWLPTSRLYSDRTPLKYVKRASDSLSWPRIAGAGRKRLTHSSLLTSFQLRDM